MLKRKNAEEFLKEAAKAGSVLGLENIENLMQELGNVQEELHMIHIAGTNGKGSVGAMLERILILAGYKVGRYSSPAVFAEEEKYQINGNNISNEEFYALVECIGTACRRMEEKGLCQPTLFEIETAAAWLYFYQNKCDVVLMEVGMGGRLDATNIIKKPLCSVITSISMDHMGFLGDTLEKIAKEKAGIIKAGCPLVSAEQYPQVEKVLREICCVKQSPIYGLTEAEVENIQYQNGYLQFDCSLLKKVQLSLLGSYQLQNAITVLHTMKCLAEQGYHVSEDSIREGLRTTTWPGRFEILKREPFFVIDGAHNRDAAEKLRKTMEMYFTNFRIIYIIGVLADKEHDKILETMLPLAEKVYAITPNNPRALAADLLKKEAKQYVEDVIAADIATAVKEAYGLAKEQDNTMVLAFGSLSYLKEVKEMLQKEAVYDR